MIHRTFIEFSLTQNSRKNTFEKEKTFNVDNFFEYVFIISEKKLKTANCTHNPHTLNNFLF